MSGEDAPPIAVGTNPFSARAALGLVLIGSLLFVALLYMIGSGSGMGSTNDGQSHAGSRGLIGYAALADYLEKRGHPVRRLRNEGALRDPGLLVLTPPAYMDGKDLQKIVDRRRYVGPTLIVAPKWWGAPPQSGQDGAKKGWVNLGGVNPPEWRGFLDDIAVDMTSAPSDGLWRGQALSGRLPAPKHMESGRGPGLEPLVVATDGRILAALYVEDGDLADPVDLQENAPQPLVWPEAEEVKPLLLVFEPDLINNYGMARRENALLADALLKAAAVQPADPVLFDLTLNGMGQSDNLLTLVFRPPFLAATLCLLMCALVVGWRAFLRFGPSLRAGRAIAFGKRALIANAAGLVRRSRRLHLMSGPYVDRARDRLVHALALPRNLAPEAADAAIDRALRARERDAEPFTHVVARLKAARQPYDLVKAARDLHALERKLTR